jgi:predicted nucleic acid-binding protein
MNEAEADDYVTFSASIDDGEAMSLAIARVRGYSLVTDDRKARQFAMNLGVEVYGTTDILRHWAEENPNAEIGHLLRAIERRARYRPPDDDPNFNWWIGIPR